MARPAKFTRDDVLDATARAVWSLGSDATIAQIADELGAPVGSLYHRFGGRDEVLAELWIRAIDRFHAVAIPVAHGSDAGQAAIDVATTIPRFCREHPLDAVAMTLFRQQWLAEHGPAPLRARIADINRDIEAAMLRLTRERYGAITDAAGELVMIACVQSPYGLVRPYLSARAEIPARLDEIVRASSTAILALGDDPDYDRTPSTASP